MFAEVLLSPGGVFAWLLVGLISGWMAGQFVRGEGYGVFADIILGLIGAMAGGLLISQFADGTAGFVGSIAIAFFGACLLIGIVHAINPKRGKLR